MTSPVPLVIILVLGGLTCYIRAIYGSSTRTTGISKALELVR